MDRLGPARSALLGAVVIASLITVPMAVGAASPAAPRPDPKPDARIAKGLAGALVGDGIYNTTAVGQAVSGSAQPTKRITFVLSAQNDATGPQRFVIKGGASGRGYTVKYLHDGLDVTARVVAGEYATPTLGPGESEVIVVRVTVKAAAAVGSRLTRTISVNGLGPNPVSDVVQFTARRS